MHCILLVDNNVPVSFWQKKEMQSQEQLFLMAGTLDQRKKNAFFFSAQCVQTDFKLKTFFSKELFYHLSTDERCFSPNTGITMNDCSNH